MILQRLKNRSRVAFYVYDFADGTLIESGEVNANRQSSRDACNFKLDTIGTPIHWRVLKAYNQEEIDNFPDVELALKGSILSTSYMINYEGTYSHQAQQMALFIREMNYETDLTKTDCNLKTPLEYYYEKTKGVPILPITWGDDSIKLGYKVPGDWYWISLKTNVAFPTIWSRDFSQFCKDSDLIDDFIVYPFEWANKTLMCLNAKSEMRFINTNFERDRQQFVSMSKALQALKASCGYDALILKGILYAKPLNVQSLKAEEILTHHSTKQIELNPLYLNFVNEMNFSVSATPEACSVDNAFVEESSRNGLQQFYKKLCITTGPYVFNNSEIVSDRIEEVNIEFLEPQMLHIMKPYAEDAIEDGVVVWQRAEGESVEDDNFTPDYEDLSYSLNSLRISSRFNVRNVLSAYAKEKMYWQKTKLLRAENSTLLKPKQLRAQ